MLCCSQRKHGADAADASGTSSSLLLEHLSKQLLLPSCSTARAGQEPGQDPRGETFPLSLPGAPLTTASREGLLSAVAHLLHQTIFFRVSSLSGAEGRDLSGVWDNPVHFAGGHLGFSVALSKPCLCRAAHGGQTPPGGLGPACCSASAHPHLAGLPPRCSVL